MSRPDPDEGERHELRFARWLRSLYGEDYSEHLGRAGMELAREEFEEHCRATPEHEDEDASLSPHRGGRMPRRDRGEEGR